MFECILYIYIYIYKKKKYVWTVYLSRKASTIQNDKIEKFCRPLIKNYLQYNRCYYKFTIV